MGTRHWPEIGSMPLKGDAQCEIVWRCLRVKQPAELPALQIILVAVGESYRM